jgi:hypothetical protein
MGTLYSTCTEQAPSSSIAAQTQYALTVLMSATKELRIPQKKIKMVEEYIYIIVQEISLCTAGRRTGLVSSCKMQKHSYQI